MEKVYEKSYEKSYDPILVYICGIKNNIKIPLLTDISNYYFVQSNNYTEERFIENSFAIIYSKVFIFIMDDMSIFDKNCLSLLGMAISYNIPVLAVREIGWTLPRAVLKHYKTVEIIDRSKHPEITLNNCNLALVTTLEKAIETLFLQAVVYYDKVRLKCTNEVIRYIENRKKINNFQSTSGVLQSTHHNHVKASIPPLVVETTTSKSVNKTTKKTKPQKSKQNNFSSLFQFNKEKKSNVNATQTKKYNGCEIIKAEKSSDNTTTIPKLTDISNHRHEKDDSKKTVMKQCTFKVPYTPTRNVGSLRRHSSLPNVATNYLVSSSPTDTYLPTIYRYPSLTKAQHGKTFSGTTNLLSLLEEDDGIISRHMSKPYSNEECDDNFMSKPFSNEEYHDELL